MYENFNEKELELIEKIEEAMKYVAGEIEVDYQEADEDYNIVAGWYALDYRKDMEAAFGIDNKAYDEPIITEEEAELYDVDVERVCDYLDIWYVG